MVLFLLVLIVCLAAGIVLVHSRKKRSDQARQSHRYKAAEIVDLSMPVSPYAILLDGERGGGSARLKKGRREDIPGIDGQGDDRAPAIRSISDPDATTTMSADFYDELYAQDASRAGFEPGEEGKSFAICCMEPCFRREQSVVCSWRSRRQASGGCICRADEPECTGYGTCADPFHECDRLHSEDQYSTPHESGEIFAHSAEK